MRPPTRATHWVSESVESEHEGERPGEADGIESATGRGRHPLGAAPWPRRWFRFVDRKGGHAPPTPTTDPA